MVFDSKGVGIHGVGLRHQQVREFVLGVNGKGTCWRQKINFYT